MQRVLENYHSRQIKVCNRYYRTIICSQKLSSAAISARAFLSSFKQIFYAPSRGFDPRREASSRGPTARLRPAVRDGGPFGARRGGWPAGQPLEPGNKNSNENENDKHNKNQNNDNDNNAREG